VSKKKQAHYGKPDQEFCHIAAMGKSQSYIVRPTANMYAAEIAGSNKSSQQSNDDSKIQRHM